jgi:sn-glycerol 3-phosphate transport system permease protein
MTPRRPLGAWLRDAALGLVALVWLFPYAWMALTSFKTLPEIVSAPTRLWPQSFELGAYHAALSAMPVGHYLLNTTLMAAGIALLQVLVVLPAGYALAKLRFAGRGLCFGLVIATLLIPAQVRFVPLFTFFAELGLTNTFTALILPFAVSALGTFLVRQALFAIPDSIIEAARMDGASELRIVYGILPPLLIPTLISLFLQLRLPLERLLLAAGNDDRRYGANASTRRGAAP